MQVPASFKPGFWGAVIGSVGTMIIRIFTFGMDSRQHRRESGPAAYGNSRHRRAHPVLRPELHEAIGRKQDTGRTPGN